MNNLLHGIVSQGGGGGGIPFTEDWAESATVGEDWTSFVADGSDGFTGTSDGASVALIPEDITPQIEDATIEYEFDIDTLSAGTLEFSTDYGPDVTEDNEDVGVVVEVTGGVNGNKKSTFTTPGTKKVKIRMGKALKMKPKFRYNSAAGNVKVSKFKATDLEQPAASSDFVTDYGLNSIGVWGFADALGGDDQNNGNADGGLDPFAGAIGQVSHFNRNGGPQIYGTPVEIADGTIAAYMTATGTFGDVNNFLDRTGAGYTIQPGAFTGSAKLVRSSVQVANLACHFEDGDGMEVRNNGTNRFKLATGNKLAMYFAVKVDSFPSAKVIYLMSTDGGTSGGYRLQLYETAGIGRMEFFVRNSINGQYYDKYATFEPLSSSGWNIFSFEIDSPSSVKFFRNGIEETTIVGGAAPVGTYIDSTHDPKFGVRGDAWAGSFYADYDMGSVAMYDLTVAGWHDQATREGIVNSMIAAQGLAE